MTLCDQGRSDKVYHSHTLKMGGEVTRILFGHSSMERRPNYDF